MEKSNLNPRSAWVLTLLLCSGLCACDDRTTDTAEEIAAEPTTKVPYKAGKLVLHEPGPGAVVGRTLHVVADSHLSNGTPIERIVVQRDGVKLHNHIAHIAAADVGAKIAFDLDLLGLPDGPLNLSLAAVSDAPLVVHKVQVTLDATDPAVDVASPIAGAMSDSVTLDALLTDSNFHQGKLWIDDVQLAATAAAGRWRTVVDLPTGMAGKHTVRVQAIDLAGNVTEIGIAVDLLDATRFPAATQTSTRGMGGGGTVQLTNASATDLDGDGKLDFLASTTVGDGLFFCDGSCHYYVQGLLPTAGGVQWNAALPQTSAGTTGEGADTTTVRWFVSARGDSMNHRLALVGMVGRTAWVVDELKYDGSVSGWMRMDVDSDGDEDIVGLLVADGQSHIAVFSVDLPATLPMNGAGALPAIKGLIGPPKLYPGVKGTAQARHADFNGDGASDLVFGRVATAVVTICFNDGKGGFVACQDTLVQGEPSPVAAVPVRSEDDKRWDLVVAGKTSSAVLYFKNDGKGHFSQLSVLPLSTPPLNIISPSAEASPIICILGASPSFTMVSAAGIVPGDTGTGWQGIKSQFICGAGYATSGIPSNVIAGDFDGDGIQDLAAVVPSKGGMDLLYGTGAGEYAAPKDLPFCTLPEQANAKPTAMAVGDFDMDGSKDLIVMGSSTASIYASECAGGTKPAMATPVWLYKSVGASATPITRYAEYAPQTDKVSAPDDDPCKALPDVTGLRAADLDGDGRSDLVATVARKYPVGVVAKPNTAPPSTKCAFTESREVDSHFDLKGGSKCSLDSQGPASGPGGGAPLLRTSAVVFRNSPSKGLGFTDKDGAGLLMPTFAFAAGLAPDGLAVGDLDGDNLPDLVTLMSQWGSSADDDFLPARLRLFKGSGKDFTPVNQAGVATYTLKGISQPKVVTGSWLSAGPGPVAARIAADANGKRLFVLDTKSEDAVVFDVDKGMTMAVPGLLLATGGQPSTFDVADLDGDGWLDILIARPGWLVVVFSDGNGGFGETAATPLWPGAPSAMGVGDFNADGAVDVAIAFSDVDRVGVLLGIGGGKLSAVGGRYPVNREPLEMVVDDVNGDGFDDILVRCGEGKSVTVIASAKLLKVWR